MNLSEKETREQIIDPILERTGWGVKFESTGFFNVIFERTLLSKTMEKIVEKK